MRPKKVIALIGLSEHRTALLRLVLRVRGYDAREYRRVGDVVRRTKRAVELTVSGDNETLRQIHEKSRSMPTILLSPLETVGITNANYVFCLKALDMFRLMEAVRTLLYRRWRPVPKQAREAA